MGLAVAVAGGCGKGDNAATGGAGGAGGARRGAVTYYKDVLPILDQHCVGCHTAGGFGPFPLTSYDETHGYSAMMAVATHAGDMPPWPPAAGCGKFRDARSLSAAEIDTLAAWDAAGAPAGDASDGTAFAPAAPVSMGAPSVTLDPGVSYRPQSTLTDDYHCFLVDPRLAADSDLIGFDIHPGTPASVHHVQLYAVTADKLALARARDAAEPGPGWTCFADAGIVATPTIAGWVPGAGASAFPPSTGIRLAAGTQIVMQIHYNLLAAQDFADHTTADLFFSLAPVAKPGVVVAILNDSFQIPPGVKSQTVTAEVAVPTGIFAVWGVAPHMHTHGTEIKLEILHPDGSSTCAIDIPRWSFHWQLFYYFERPLIVVAGDTVRLSCTYDNSPESQPVVRGVQQPPAALQWGEKTTDEMCLDFAFVSFP